MAKSIGEFFVKIGGDISELDKALTAAEKKFKSSTENLQKIGKGLTTFVTLPILAIGAAAVKSAADMEMQQAAFETLLGSASEAEKMLKSLADFAAKTPFQLPDLAQAAKTMLSFGIESEKVLPTLKQLGDIAQGDSVKLKSLTLAFSQIQSTGRLMGQDLLQLINAGFNPLQIISEKTGKTMRELKEDMEKGAISAEQVAEAFEIATSEGGRFFGGMEKASQTFSGQISTLKDNVGALGRSLVESLLPVLKQIVGTLSAWVQEFSKLDTQQKKTIIGLSLFAAAIGPVILGILNLINTLGKLKVAMLFLNAHPAILAFTAIAAAVAVVAIGFKKARDEANNLNAALSGNADLERTRLGLQAQLLKVEAAREAIAKAAQSRQTGPTQEKLIADLESNLRREEQNLKLINDNYQGKLRNIQSDKDRQAAADKASQAEQKAAEDAAKAALARLNAIEATTAATEDKKEAVEDLAEVIVEYEKNANNLYKKQLESQGEIYNALELERKLRREMDEEKTEREIDWQALQKLGITSMLQGFTEIGAALVAQELTWKSFAKVALNAFAEILNAIGAELAARAALAVITGNWAGAAIAGAAAAVAFTASGAVKASVANLADGGIVMPRPGGVPVTVAEAGVPEIVGPLDKVESMLRAAGGSVDSTPIHLVVKLDSKPFLDKIFPATKNRTVLISAASVV